MPIPSLSNRSGAASCTLETLARSSALHVQRCAHCNTLSLHFGPITLRFDAATAEDVWNTLGQALLRLHARREGDEDDRAGTWGGAN